MGTDGTGAGNADIDIGSFWQAVGQRAVAATVVTARGSAGPSGFLGLSATHVCADPPTMLVSIDARTSALGAIRESGHFAINYLPKGAEHVVDLFGGAARSHSRHRRDLGLKHQVIKVSLFTTEATIHGEGACDVAVVVIAEGASGINQQQIAVTELGAIGDVVENAGVIPTGNDRSIGRTTRTRSQKVLFNQRLDLAFPHSWLGGLPGQFMGLSGNPTGLPKTLQLLRSFLEAQTMQQRAGGHQSQCCSTGAGLPVELRPPGLKHQRFHLGMMTNPEGDAFGALEIVRQQLRQILQGMGKIGPEMLHRPLDTPAAPRPDFSPRFAGLHKQHITLPFRTMGQEQSNRIRLIESGEVPEVAVLAERPFAIGMVGDQRRSRNHRSGITQKVKETLTPLGMAVLIDHGEDRASGFRQDGRQSVPP